MQLTHSVVASFGLAAGLVSASPCGPGGVSPIKKIDLGPRPFFLVDDMDEGPLKKKLNSCKEKDMKASDFSIGHRGG
jgi:glycerophosphoryl diester phosphodiesterase